MKILAFGIAKEILGGSTVDLELEGDHKVGALRELLNDQYPALARLKSYLIAVNDEYANADLTINEKDEIAIIPPVSGG